mmetsp:Transcript_28459/g.32566  ORF Transcript_28459/g.32566 Transcript_28459/m.32566 type:complete len:360 (-) Transcript_28459:106-1185(-)
MQQQTLLFGSSSGAQKPKTEKMETDEVDESKNHLLPWIEKYRPKSVADVADQPEVVSALSTVLKTGTLPHLLFYGPPGTGKTSSILALAKELFGPNLYRSRVLELNASDDRGIAVVREKVKKFAQTAVTKNPKEKYLCPAYKIIILDEADSMTNEAQSALRRIMETYTNVTRFCIICNYVSRIIDPIVSRCVKFRFRPLASSIQFNQLEMICKKESIGYEREALDTLVDISDGDMRKSITNLQSAARFYQDNLTQHNVYEMSGFIPNGVIDDLCNVILSNSFEDLQKNVKSILLEAYPVNQVISQLFDLMIQKPELDDIKKAKISEKLAQAEKYLLDGGDEEIQLLYATSHIMKSLFDE